MALNKFAFIFTLNGAECADVRLRLSLSLSYNHRGSDLSVVNWENFIPTFIYCPRRG